MWELSVVVCWFAILIPAAIIGFRRDEPVAGAAFGFVLCLVAAALGIWLSGWFVFAIFALAMGLAFVPPTAEEVQAMRQAGQDRERNFQREMRRDELKAIKEDYKLGLIDAEERDRQLAEAGFNND